MVDQVNVVKIKSTDAKKPILNMFTCERIIEFFIGSVLTTFLQFQWISDILIYSTWRQVVKLAEIWISGFEFKFVYNCKFILVLSSILVWISDIGGEWLIYFAIIWILVALYWKVFITRVWIVFRTKKNIKKENKRENTYSEFAWHWKL